MEVGWAEDSWDRPRAGLFSRGLRREGREKEARRKSPGLEIGRRDAAVTLMTGGTLLLSLRGEVRVFTRFGALLHLRLHRRGVGTLEGSAQSFLAGVTGGESGLISRWNIALNVPVGT